MMTERILIVDDEETLCEVLKLNLGADDYITKPYTIRNVIARVKTVLRRTEIRIYASKVITYIQQKPSAASFKSGIF